MSLMHAFHNHEHERLARAAVDDSRLMLDEDPTSMQAEDVRHWLTVYRELAQFKRAILHEMYENLPSMNGVSATEVSSVDMVIIRAQLRRYERRIAFWEGREAELKVGLG